VVDNEDDLVRPATLAPHAGDSSLEFSPPVDGVRTDDRREGPWDALPPERGCGTCGRSRATSATIGSAHDPPVRSWPRPVRWASRYWSHRLNDLSSIQRAPFGGIRDPTTAPWTNPVQRTRGRACDRTIGAAPPLLGARIAPAAHGMCGGHEPRGGRTGPHLGRPGMPAGKFRPIPLRISHAHSPSVSPRRTSGVWRSTWLLPGRPPRTV
jgi:hypothetical protein